MDLSGARVLVTGAAGFLGSHVVERLRARNLAYLATPGSSDFDLRRQDHVAGMLSSYRPDVVIHLAARVGGIGANQRNPGSFFYENAIMGIELIEQSRLAGVSKFVTVGTVCAYPKFTPVPFREADLWSGYPEETNAPYGLAKKILLVQGQAYRKQYGFNSIYLLPANLYGPGDHFDLEDAHVIPALIMKFLAARAAGLSSVVLWGTGRPTREFLYVKDAARAIDLATERYDDAEPVNVGSSFEIAIADLAAMIADITGFTGEVVWDASKPDGQPRRRLDVSRAERLFGFRATTPFTLGLRETVDWYSRHARAAVLATRHAEELSASG